MGTAAEVVHYVVLAEETRRIHDNAGVRIPWHWTCNSDTKVVSVTWDPERTRLVRARLHARVYSDLGAVFFNYYVNDNRALGFTWEEWEPGIWREDEVDITIYIRNGDNYFKAEACKHYPYPLEPTVWVTGTLILEFEGEPPTIQPPRPPAPSPWEIALYVGLGIAGIVALAYLIQALRGR